MIVFKVNGCFFVLVFCWSCIFGYSQHDTKFTKNNHPTDDIATAGGQRLVRGAFINRQEKFTRRETPQGAVDFPFIFKDRESLTFLSLSLKKLIFNPSKDIQRSDNTKILLNLHKRKDLALSQKIPV